MDGQGRSGPSTEFGPFTTAFSGSRSDWLPGQEITALSGEPFFLTWSASRLYVGASGPGGVPPLGTGDQLWVAFDGDPNAGYSLFLASGESLWVPFGVEQLVRLTVRGPASTQLTIEGVTGIPDLLSTPQYEGLVDEFALDRSALTGVTTTARVAMAIVRNGQSRVADLAPVNPDALDLTGAPAVITSGLDFSAHIWDPAAAARSAVDATPFRPEGGLVRFTVRATTNVGAPRLRGNGMFLSFDSAIRDIPTFDDGTRGDLTANDGVFSVRVPACQTDLRFKFADDLGEEPALPIGSDRIWTCGFFGHGDFDPPEATWSERWSATHPFTLNFGVNSGGTPTQLRGNANELGNWGTTAGPSLTDLGPAGIPNSSAHFWAVEVTFAPRDMVTSPLAWKAFYGPDASNYEGGSDHVLNDDVMGYWDPQWWAGDGRSF